MKCGSQQATARSNGGNSASESNGSSWSTPTTAPWLTTEEPDCQASMVRLPGSTWLVISSPYYDAGRQNLTIHVSDNGNLQPYKQIDPGPSGYSSVAAINDSTCVLWESKGTGALWHVPSCPTYETIVE